MAASQGGDDLARCPVCMVLFAVLLVGREDQAAQTAHVHRCLMESNAKKKRKLNALTPDEGAAINAYAEQTLPFVAESERGSAGVWLQIWQHAIESINFLQGRFTGAKRRTKQYSAAEIHREYERMNGRSTSAPVARNTTTTPAADAAASSSLGAAAPESRGVAKKPAGNKRAKVSDKQQSKTSSEPTPVLETGSEKVEIKESDNELGHDIAVEFQEDLISRPGSSANLPVARLDTRAIIIGVSSSEYAERKERASPGFQLQFVAGAQVMDLFTVCNAEHTSEHTRMQPGEASDTLCETCALSIFGQDLAVVDSEKSP